jgi:hypothetical protein
MARSINENISIQEFDGKLVRALVRMINEAISIETLARRRAYSMAQIVNETLGISELPTRFGTMKRIVSESISISELAKAPLSLVIRINETLNLGPIVHGGQLAFSHLTEALAYVVYGLVKKEGTVRTSDKTKTVRGEDPTGTVRGT